jgi:hypothetical protein
MNNTILNISNNFNEGDITLNNEKYRFLSETIDGTKTFYNGIALLENHIKSYRNHQF